MRCFISIDIPEEVKLGIKKIQERLPEFRGKKTELENLHLTLKFLGEVNEEKVEEIKKRLRGFKFNKFETIADEMGVFSENSIRIIWLRLSGFEEMQWQIDNALMGLFESDTRFMSHLTIARVKQVGDKKEFLEDLKKIDLPEVKFNVDNFRLKKSVLTAAGPVYETLEEFRFD